ncbi:arginine N-succinyltransferase [Pseudoalteromonas fenneropenaei]|uniref:Arginine N-succinyltransferase n=1 Tax=Pseudoalteromonas fenneropenaei TaxID=1737459 RepID=A0ABV7CMS5_9GAMM
MKVLRPITQQDFASLRMIAEESGPGFTSLPVDDNKLSNKITRSMQSFEKSVVRPHDEGYLFVLEDHENKTILGTTAIEAAVGMDVPLYHYYKSKSVHHSPTLNVYNTVEVLTMCNDYTGATEICTLFLRPDHRKGLAGRFLSRSRFLFMADHSDRFSERVIAEMRGVNDEQGHSPFWEWLQAHFFSIDFPVADHLVGLGNKVFIAELMPKHPIYVNLLSEEAQAVIGQVHEKTIPALRLLEKEGFEHRGYVDLFDAGPTVEAKLHNIRSVRESVQCPIEIVDGIEGNTTLAISNRKLVDFRATYTNWARYDEARHCLQVRSEVADALQLSASDSVRFFEL